MSNGILIGLTDHFLLLMTFFASRICRLRVINLLVNWSLLPCENSVRSIRCAMVKMRITPGEGQLCTNA